MAILLSKLAPLDVTIPDGPDVTLRLIGKLDQGSVRVAYAKFSSESQMIRFWEKPAEMSR